jgi:voltage-gated potassium channel
VDVTPEIETEHRPGQPRSERDADFLKRWDARMRLPIIASAVLPLIVVPGPDNWFDITVGIVTWLVFLIDYVVRTRHLDHYGRSRLGMFDLFVVVATAPWFLIPGAQAGGFVVLLRLARLARLAVASRGSRRLFERLGRVALVAVGVLVTGSLVAYYAERATNPEFATVGDALWWGIVTLTTVGYGDIVPKTTTGRLAAVAIMITGIAVLGVLAGSLSSFFRLDEGGNGAGSPAGKPAGSPAASNDAALAALTNEVSALRRQVEVLTARLTGTPPDLASEEPAPGEDAQARPLSAPHRSCSDRRGPHLLSSRIQCGRRNRRPRTSCRLCPESASASTRYTGGPLGGGSWLACASSTPDLM